MMFYHVRLCDFVDTSSITIDKIDLSKYDWYAICNKLFMNVEYVGLHIHELSILEPALNVLLSPYQHIIVVPLLTYFSDGNQLVYMQYYSLLIDNNKGSVVVMIVW